LDETGKWSHKPGISRTTNLDNNGAEIQDPTKAAMGSYLFHKFMTSDRTGNNVRIAGPVNCCARLLKYAFTNCFNKNNNKAPVPLEDSTRLTQS